MAPPLLRNVLTHITGQPLSRRSLRSGKEFSPFDLAQSLAILPAKDFDIEACLRMRAKEQEAMGLYDEPGEVISATTALESLSLDATGSDLGPEITTDLPLGFNTCLSPAESLANPPSTLTPSSSVMAWKTAIADPTTTADVRNKLKSKVRRANAREKVRQAANNPYLKGVHLKRVQKAKPAAIEVEYDAMGLPHTIPAWIGDRTAQNRKFDFGEPLAPHDGETGMGGRQYTQEEVDKLTGTEGFMYIAWLGLYVLITSFVHD